MKRRRIGGVGGIRVYGKEYGGWMRLDAGAGPQPHTEVRQEAGTDVSPTLYS